MNVPVHFSKYQALGNDYLVVDGTAAGPLLTTEVVRRVCDRHFGIGADGILVAHRAKDEAAPTVQVFNPDGSTVEKSGNGLRIFARYLWDHGLVKEEPFPVRISDEIVTCRVRQGGRLITVDMGRVRFDSAVIPVKGPFREVLEERLEVGNVGLTFSAATIGNPHCVILRERVTEEDARRLGPLVEVDPRFPNRTNVQFVEVIDRANLRIEIWERGAGYTLASGSSSCAATAVVHRLGLCDPHVTVHLRGGELDIEVREHFDMRMTGGVARVADIWFAAESWPAAEADGWPGAIPDTATRGLRFAHSPAAGDMTDA
jgi:diaminopimelate epimerase